LITPFSPGLELGQRQVTPFCSRKNFENLTVTFFSLSTMIILGVSVPVKSPPQLSNSHPSLGIGLSSTVVPYGYYLPE